MIMYTYSATKVCQTAWSIVFCENSPLKKRLWHNWKGGNFHPPTTLVSLSSWKGVCNKIVVDKRSNEMRWFSTQDLNVWLKDFFADLHSLQNVFSTSFVPVKGSKNCCTGACFVRGLIIPWTSGIIVGETPMVNI